LRESLRAFRRVSGLGSRAAGKRAREVTTSPAEHSASWKLRNIPICSVRCRFGRPACVTPFWRHSRHRRCYRVFVATLSRRTERSGSQSPLARHAPTRLAERLPLTSAGQERPGGKTHQRGLLGVWRSIWSRGLKSFGPRGSARWHYVSCVMCHRCVGGAPWGWGGARGMGGKNAVSCGAQWSVGVVGSDNHDLPVFPNPVRREMTPSSRLARSRVLTAMPSSFAASSASTASTSPLASSRFRKSMALFSGFAGGGGGRCRRTGGAKFGDGIGSHECASPVTTASANL
jgi:hypothetical protein